MQRTPHPPPGRPKRLLLGAVALGTVLTLGTGMVAGTTNAGASTSGQHPRGHLGSAVQFRDGIALHGWAIDPDTSAPAKVKITVDGKPAATLTADAYHTPFPDRPGYGTHRAYATNLRVPAGKHTVCAYAIDYPSRTARWLLDCKKAVVADPFGHLRPLTRVPGYAKLTGWAIDPDAPARARTVVVRLDGKVVTSGLADLARRSLTSAYPDAGSYHGFSFKVRVPAGRHRLCVTARNYGPGTNQTFSCRTNTYDYSPTGQLTRVQQRPGGVRVAGWAADPDTTAPIAVSVTAGGTVLGTGSANRSGGKRPGHGYDLAYRLPGTKIRPGSHWICVVGKNAGKFGHSRKIGCASKHLNFNPSARVDAVTQHAPGARITGRASDPDTTGPINVMITADGKKIATIKANVTSRKYRFGHGFSTVVALPNGRHTVCAIALNARFGSANSAPACKTVSLDFNPYGKFQSLKRTSNDSALRLTGWAIDPDTTAPIKVKVGVEGHVLGTWAAGVKRPDVAAAHPGTGPAHGFSVTVPASAGEHRVCVSALNTGGGTGNRHFACKVVIAVHPHVPSAPRTVGAQAGYGGAAVTWTAPARDGGAPRTSYTVTTSHGKARRTVGPSTTSTTVSGLKPNTHYHFLVVAHNVAGTSAAASSGLTRTRAAPPRQTTPAPISTSRYIRNISGASSNERATMRREGVADARANPSGHGYLILLDIGGQSGGAGVVLSAGVRFVTYANLVKDLQSYVAGYASAQRPSSPITIALGTNNDMDVSRTTGAVWANRVVDPVASFAARYPGVTIAGANDVEPGFRASYSQTNSWLTGYLHATKAPFVFNGSADGCAWTQPGRGCNNGWRMSGLYHLAGGAAPIRIVNLPQIYNTTMAQQWRYISLTGVNSGSPRINFGGALTEWTACHQAGGCGSLTGNSAWTTMWHQLRAEPKLKIASLPYSTDLRIDR